MTSITIEMPSHTEGYRLEDSKEVEHVVKNAIFMPSLLPETIELVILSMVRPRCFSSSKKDNKRSWCLRRREIMAQRATNNPPGHPLHSISVEQALKPHLTYFRCILLVCREEIFSCERFLSIRRAAHADAAREIEPFRTSYA